MNIYMTQQIHWGENEVMGINTDSVDDYGHGHGNLNTLELPISPSFSPGFKVSLFVKHICL